MLERKYFCATVNEEKPEERSFDCDSLREGRKKTRESPLRMTGLVATR